MREVTVIEKKKRKPIRTGQAVKIIVFLLITAMIFHFFTLLYDRPVTPRLIDYRNQKENSLDVVSIGASTVYRYFNSMELWEQAGITSYAYGIAGADGENTIYSLKEVLKKQNPKVVVLEVRGFLNSRDRDGFGSTMYRFIKNYPNPFDRWKILRHYSRLHSMKFSSDQLPYYLTLLLNHENYWSLLNGQNWKKALMGSESVYEKPRNQFMGYGPVSKVVPQSGMPYDSDTKTPLADAEEKALRETLDYCRRIGQNVLLVASPFVYTDADTAQLNSIADIADEYGVPYLNTNQHLEEMGIDWSTDFYNPNHTNLIGATKYTDYLLEYLKENYDLPDHRGDNGYSQWEETDKEYQSFRETTLAELNQNLTALKEGQTENVSKSSAAEGTAS